MNFQYVSFFLSCTVFIDIKATMRVLSAALKKTLVTFQQSKNDENTHGDRAGYKAWTA
jgi:hypothetical protein